MSVQNLNMLSDVEKIEATSHEPKCILLPPHYITHLHTQKKMKDTSLAYNKQPLNFYSSIISWDSHRLLELEILFKLDL